MSISNYSQPEFYKFNSDSIDLVKYAIEEFNKLKNISVLDICSGCGIIGIEFSQLHESVSDLTLVELQSEYRQHIKKNIERLDLDVSIIIEDYKVCKLNQKFDIILCNPPYFKPDSGRVSPNENRQRSRTYQKGDLVQLIEFGISSLKEGGEFIIVHREDLNRIDDRFIKVKEVGGAKLFRFILNVD